MADKVYQNTYEILALCFLDARPDQEHQPLEWKLRHLRVSGNIQRESQIALNSQQWLDISVSIRNSWFLMDCFESFRPELLIMSLPRQEMFLLY